MKKIFIISICIVTVIITVLNLAISFDIQNKYPNYKGYFFDNNLTQKVTNKEQIDRILNKNNNLSYEVLDKFNSYDDNYFNTKDLIVVYFPLDSGSINTKMKEVIIDNIIEVIISVETPEAGTDDKSGYIYFIELDKSDKVFRAYLEENDIKKEIID